MPWCESPRQKRIGAARLQSAPERFTVGCVASEALAEIRIGQGHDGRLWIGLSDGGL